MEPALCDAGFFGEICQPGAGMPSPAGRFAV